MKIDENYTTFIHRLRDEADELKDCFTKFSFQAILFTSAALGFIGTFSASSWEKIFVKGEDADNDLFALIYIFFTVLACMSVIIFLLNVARVGLYKYTSSNRHFGYELYLSKKLQNTGMLTFSDYNWEEKMVGWRVVQATLFGFIYSVQKEGLRSLIFPRRNVIQWDKLKAIFKKEVVDGNDKDGRKLSQKKLLEKYKSAMEPYSWFLIPKNVGPKASYHAGSYLKKMMFVLHLLASIMMIILISFLLINTIAIEYENIWYGVLSYILSWSIGILISAHLIFSITSNDRRRKIVESELLSIYCCSIVWKIVDITLNTTNNTHKQNRVAKSGDQNFLSILADTTAEWKKNVFEWEEVDDMG